MYRFAALLGQDLIDRRPAVVGLPDVTEPASPGTDREQRRKVRNRPKGDLDASADGADLPASIG